jgi:hypothetical protein
MNFCDPYIKFEAITLPMLYAFVDHAVRRSNRILLFASLALLIAGVTAAALSGRYTYNLLAGPFPLTDEDLLSIENASSNLRYRVTVDGAGSFDTEYEYTERERVIYSYAAVPVADRLLLVQIPGRQGNTGRSRYTGLLVDIHPRIQAGIIRAIEQRQPELTGVFLPYVLNITPLGGWGYVGLALNGLVVVVGMMGTGIALVRTAHPERHPMLKGLHPYGSPEEVLEEIEREINDNPLIIGNLYLTHHWLVSKTPSSLEATRYEDILWVYRKMTHQSSYSVLIHDRYGKVMAQRTRELKANELVNLIHKRAPWAVAEYSRDTESAWRSQRQMLAAEVDARRP